MNIANNSVATLIQTPKISIVMAVYNSACYLNDAISSILEQSVLEFELIAVNDGSTDESAEMLDRFAKQDPRIRVIHQVNQGVGAATNTGIKASLGEYIAIMDSDDIALPNRLEIQKNFLDAHLDIAGVGGQFLDIDTENRILGLDFQPTQPEIVSCCNHAFFSLHHPTTMVRRSAFEAVGLYLEDRHCLAPDYDVFTRMQAAGFRFANVPQVVLKWRLNPNGLTHGSAIAQTQSSHAIRQWGFAQLFHTNPDQARQTARHILMSFPEGTWFDEKLHRLLPEEDRAYLFNALKQNSNPALYFSTLEYLILDWFEGKLTNVASLVASLNANGLPWFAHQLAVRYGLADANDSLSQNTQHYPSASRDINVSVLVPFEKSDADLLARIENIRQCCPNAEIVVFPLTPDAEDCSIDNCSDVVFISSAEIKRAPWEAAFSAASGRFLAYLEPYFRFEPDTFIQAVNKLNEGASLLYTPSERYFMEALDKNSLPYPDPSPHPRWTSETLLGQNRIVLSGFCHRRELLASVIPLLSECGASFPLALALSFAHRHEMAVVAGRIQEYIPYGAIENRVILRFKENIIHWYFNAGLGTLPDTSTWETLSTTKANRIARRLDQVWRKGQFQVHWGNRFSILSFLCRKVTNPLLLPLFRELTLTHLQIANNEFKLQNRVSELILCTAYADFSRTFFRLKKLLNF